MKKTIVVLFNIYKNIISFLTRKNRFGEQYSFIIFCILMLISILLYEVFKDIPLWVVGFPVLIISIMMSFFMPICDSKIIRFITHKKMNTPKELFHQFSHVSFIFFLIFFTFDLISWLIFIGTFVCMLFNINIKLYFNFNVFAYVFIIIAFIMCVLYFCYHIYINPSTVSLNKIKLSSKLYAAIISTLTFIVGIIGIDNYFKLLLSGLTLAFSWIQYVILSEEKSNRENTITETSALIDSSNPK